MNKLWFGAVLAGLAALGGCRSSAPTRRELRELGSVALPSRLETYRPVETETYALFPFDRTANSFLLMGSNRPVPEKLVVAVWTPESRKRAHEAAVSEAGERTDGVTWRTDGNGFEIGEGVHEVNTARNPAWILARDFPSHSLTVAYMVWKKAGSLEQARRTVEEAGTSFRPSVSPAEYLKLAKERPAKERRARWQSLEAALAKRGVHLGARDEPVERDGRWYVRFTDSHWGGMFATLAPLGSLPRAASYEHLRPAAPQEVGNWPDVVYFVKDGPGGTWRFRGIDDEPRDLPDSLTKRVERRQDDTPNATDRAYFYAVSVHIMDDADMQAPDLDYFERAASRMADSFRNGELIRAR
jgi:hypothetical protein